MSDLAKRLALYQSTATPVDLPVPLLGDLGELGLRDRRVLLVLCVVWRRLQKHLKSNEQVWEKGPHLRCCMIKNIPLPHLLSSGWAETT